MAEICRFIETADHVPSLAELASKAGMSTYHFHRVFKAVSGVTPGAYARSTRAKRVRDELGRREQSVTEAIYGAGFNSNSRFYEASDEMLGMKPSDYRAGGANTAIHFCDRRVFARLDPGRAERARRVRDLPRRRAGSVAARAWRTGFRKAELIGGDDEFETLVAKVVGFVEAPKTGLDLPLDVRGTAFQQRVWRALQAIPAGKTVSYAEVAKRIGAPKAVRAVANACAANPIAVAIPCHRVVRKGGEAVRLSLGRRAQAGSC